VPRISSRIPSHDESRDEKTTAVCLVPLGTARADPRPPAGVLLSELQAASL
jgi:hypothetical protein